MTTVFVSVTSILIDLKRGCLLEAAFQLDAVFTVPDVLFEKELQETNGAILIELGLKIKNWIRQALSVFTDISRKNPLYHNLMHLPFRWPRSTG